jgi:3D (Asp-Asp-Asp) domain-containing protein
MLLGCGSSATSGLAALDGGGGSGGAFSDAGTAGAGGAGGFGGNDTAGAAGASGAGGVDASLPPPGPPLGSFKLTYYWVTTEAEHTGAKSTALYDPACKVLATVSAGFASALKLEGTGRLSDGRLLNYDGPCACPLTPCYFEADAQHPWGYGVQNRALTPFRSIAVDKDSIAIGTSVYVAELDGVSMPGDQSYGAFVHDGCVVADDVGGGISGAHIDFFAALKAHYQTLDAALGLQNVTLYAGGARCP